MNSVHTQFSSLVFFSKFHCKDYYTLCQEYLLHSAMQCNNASLVYPVKHSALPTKLMFLHTNFLSISALQLGMRHTG